MDDFYSIPVNSDPKHGLALSPSDLDSFQFPTLGGDFDQEHLLSLEDSQSFCLGFQDTIGLGVYDEALSRASSAVTPQSDCSTRTTISARNLSPTSDILTFSDKPVTQDIEAMYHDTTQSIISSNRQSRTASTAWPATSTHQSGIGDILTPPMRTISHRPQSFSYRTPQISQDNNTPPPPSSFFSSPNLNQHNTNASSSFVSPNLAALGSQMPQLRSQNVYMQAGLISNPTSYYTQSQAFQQSPNPSFQQQLQEHFQQQNLSLQQPITHRRSIQGPIPTQAQLTPPLFGQTHLSSQSNMPATATASMNSTSVTPTLPNTTGNSSTGYQCFSHGCGGRHFSNWGNLVRHHRERQLRSKAGAKPTCQRCGKGFTRSSARDAHVAGLKCVLGRRRRGGTASGNQSSTSGPGAGTGSGNSAAGTGSSPSGGAKVDLAIGDASVDGDANGDLQVLDRDDNGSEGSREDIDLGDIEAGLDHEGDDDDLDLLGSNSLTSHIHSHVLPSTATGVTATQLATHVAASDTLTLDLGLSTTGGHAGRSYLAPQQLHFGH